MAQIGGSRGTSTSAIVDFLSRNNLSAGAGRYPRDAWHNYLVSILGSDGTLADLEKQWLRSRITTLGGVQSAGEGWSDLWGAYLTAKGYTTGQLDDKMATWLQTGTP